MLIKDYIQIRLRLRLATKDDLTLGGQPKYGQVYWVLDDGGTVSGSYVIDKSTDKKTLNHHYKLDRVYVEETPLCKTNIIELYT